jgi:hypothetical protein
VTKDEIKDIELNIEKQLLIYDTSSRSIKHGLDIKRHARLLMESTHAINKLLDRLDNNEIQLNTKELN